MGLKKKVFVLFLSMLSARILAADYTSKSEKQKKSSEAKCDDRKNTGRLYMWTQSLLIANGCQVVSMSDLLTSRATQSPLHPGYERERFLNENRLVGKLAVQHIGLTMIVVWH